MTGTWQHAWCTGRESGQRALAATHRAHMAWQLAYACRIIRDHFVLVVGIVAAELLTVLLYLWALKFLFVSYVVAAKRSGILLSVVSGWLFFGERIRDKIGYIFVMIAGMLLIVLAPDMRYNLHLRNP
jgi:drug/metabolite transporter (DMT)-like permease